MEDQIHPPTEADWKNLNKYSLDTVYTSCTDCPGHDADFIEDLDLATEYFSQRLEDEVKANDLDAAYQVISEYLLEETEPLTCRHHRSVYDIGAVKLALKYDNAEFAEKVMTKSDMVRFYQFLKAARGRAKRCIELFLRNGLDLNNPPDKSVREVGMVMADPEIAHLLVDHGVSLNTKGHVDETVLSYIVIFGPPELVDELLSDPRDLVDRNRGELLFHAIERPGPLSSAVDMLRVLLDHGYPINQTHYANCKFSQGWFSPTGLGTPLHWAVIVGNIEAVRYLVARHADVMIRDQKNRTAWAYAKHVGKTEIMEFLRGVMDECKVQHL